MGQVTLSVSSDTGEHRITPPATRTHTVAVPPVMVLTGTRTGAIARERNAPPPPDAGEWASGPRYREVFYVTGGLPDGYRLRVALPVIVQIEAGEYVAEQPQLDLHAFGETPADAILSLRDELTTHYALLEEMGDRLSSRLARQRDDLRRVLAPPDA
jgi:hypothetical protein